MTERLLNAVEVADWLGVPVSWGGAGDVRAAKAGHAHGSTTERYLHAHRTRYPDAAELAEARLFTRWADAGRDRLPRRPRLRVVEHLRVVVPVIQFRPLGGALRFPAGRTDVVALALLHPRYPGVPPNPASQLLGHVGPLASGKDATYASEAGGAMTRADSRIADA